MKRFVLIALSFLWAQATAAASTIIVDGQYVAEAIARNAIVWDVRAADCLCERTYCGRHQHRRRATSSARRKYRGFHRDGTHREDTWRRRLGP